MTTSATSTASMTGIAPQAQRALAYLRRAIEKMKALQAAERVMASIERVMLNRVPDRFDLHALVTVINELNLALREGDEDKVREAVFSVSQELETVFQALVVRDTAIMPYHLRRFCDEETTALDLNTLAALTSFYRALPHTDANRGKYDFVVTQLFSHVEPGHSSRHRHLRISREQLTKRLTEMCMAWGETILRDPADTTNISQCIHQFDQFIAEAKQINKFEELVSRAFFQRVRSFKTQVGALLYLPEITAASIESNVIITNRFLTLLEIESEELQAASPTLQCLTNAFSDTYSNEPDEISAILRELQASAQNDERAQERVSRLTNLLQIPAQQEDALEAPLEASLDAGPSLPLPQPPLESEFSPSPEALPEPAFMAEPMATGEVDEQLLAFFAEPENQSLVESYRRASADTRKLDLPSFLSPLPDGGHTELKDERATRRAALELIFQADHIAFTELGKDCEPNAELDTRIEKLFDQLGELSDKVRDQIKVVAKHEQNANYDVLLDVYNQLMTARLRLQSALVRRSTSEETDAVPAEETHTKRRAAITPDASTAPQSGAHQTPGAHNSRRKWLVIAVFVSLVIALGANFLMRKKQVAKDDAEVARLDRTQMPHGDLFTEAKLHQDLMICIVTPKWLDRSAHEQKEKLKEVFTYGQERGAQRIMLISLKGTTVGFVSKEDIFVN